MPNSCSLGYSYAPAYWRCEQCGDIFCEECSCVDNENDGAILCADCNIIKYAEFTSVWDGGYAITTKCKVNIKTKEIFDIDSVDAGDDFDCLDREFVMVGGEYYEAIRIDEDENEHLGLYWYKCGRKNYERKDESKWKITEIRNT